MKFIEALKLRSKLSFLFFLITFGLISVSILGFIQLNRMKENIDNLYFGSLVPVTELNSIIQTYSNDLSNIVYKSARLETSSEETSREIIKSIDFINTKWKTYESHFKRDEELQYLGYVEVEIAKTNHYFERLAQLAKENTPFDRVNIDVLEKKIAYIHGVIKKLLKYEEDIAYYERKY